MTKKTKSNTLCLPGRYGINSPMIIILMLGILNLLLPSMSWGEETSEKAIKLEPLHPQSHYNLGIAYGSKGRNDEARREMALGMRLEQAAQY